MCRHRGDDNSVKSMYKESMVEDAAGFMERRGEALITIRTGSERARGCAPSRDEHQRWRISEALRYSESNSRDL